MMSQKTDDVADLSAPTLPPNAVALARKEVTKAERKLREAKANLARIEKESKGGK